MDIRMSNNDGWTAESFVPVPGLPADRVLHVSTWKHSNGYLFASVNLVTVMPDGKGYSWAMFSDYDKRIKGPPLKRASEKAVRDFHASVLAGIDPYLAEAAAFDRAAAAELAKENA